MLSRTIWRTLLEFRSQQLPPIFLLPWTANLSTVSRSTEPPSTPPPTSQGSTSHMPTQSLQPRPKYGKRFNASNGQKASNASLGKLQQSLEQSLERCQASPKLPSSTNKQSPLILSRSVRDLLPVLQAQSPHYITAHIHGFPYLLTEGDTVRLPFLMHGVEPGDVIRLNRAINLGSRDLTLKAPAPGDKIKSPVTSSRHVVDPTTGSLTTHSNVMPEGAMAPHFIPHIAKGKHSYIDDRLFVCRAVVMGVESEPLRIKVKTKRRQRHVRKVKSKHRYTILKIKELRVKSVDEIGGNRIEE